MKNKLEGYRPPFYPFLPTDRPSGDLDQETRADSATESFLPAAWCSEADGGSCGRLMKPSGTAQTRTSRLHSETGDGRRKTCFQNSEKPSGLLYQQ